MVKSPVLSPGLILLTVLCVGSVPFATVPPWSEQLATVLYYGAFVLIQVLTVLGVRRIPAARRGSWNLMVVTSVLWAVGETYTLLAELGGDDSWPSPADIGYVAGYLVMAVAVLRLDRRTAHRAGWGPLLDALVVTLSVGILTMVFVVRPLVGDAGQPLLVRVVASLYPVIDVLLVYLVARLLGHGRSRGAPVLWLSAAMLSTFTADTLMNLGSVEGNFAGYTPALNFLWLLFYLFVAFAAVETARAAWPGGAARPAPARADGPDLGVLRLALLTLAAMLPSLVIVAYGWWAPLEPGTSEQLGAGSVLLLTLVAARIWSLIAQLRRQARQLDELATTDPLTGLANRRSWDHQVARLMDEPPGGPVLLAALLDLDRFKAFNDTHGHQAGDDLLRRSAQAWRAHLGASVLLARWGGEEFAVLLPTDDVAAGLARLDGLRRVVPAGQTVSIGVARWDGTCGAEDLLRAADGALYRAKDTGRDRMVTAGDLGRLPDQPVQSDQPDQPAGAEPVAAVPLVRRPVDTLDDAVRADAGRPGRER